MTEQKQRAKGRASLLLSVWLILVLGSSVTVNVASAAASTSEVGLSEPVARPSNSSASETQTVRTNVFSEDEVGDEPEEEYEGEGVDEDEDEDDDGTDEYAEELRAAAESHEAMSRHEEQTNRTKAVENHPSTKGEDGINQKLDHAAKKDFDSREKSVENGSDESESSNEAILEDSKVLDPLKYGAISYLKRLDGSGEKSRRGRKEEEEKEEETVKKEARVEKRFSTKEMLDELNKQFKHSTLWTEIPYDATSPSTGNDSSGELDDLLETEAEDYLERNYPGPEKIPDSLDPEEITGSRKLDKRQEAVLRDLETYLRAEYAAEQEQQQKLQELGAQEGALAESLLELLVKLAENPSRWERVHRLLMDVEGGLELSRRALEARKRAFSLTSTTTDTPVSETPKKPRKKPKKKKKKKKQRHHRFSTTATTATTTTTLPTILPLLTTTETPPWLATPMQWRLVAERLFGQPWPQDLQVDPGLAKVRFTVPSNPRTPPPSREFSEQLDEHKALNSERQALMLESSREYTQPRRLHYGKVSTHQGGTPSRVRDYDPPERYAQYDFIPAQSYAQNREYRPPGREYAASRSWHESRYNYGWPSWKTEQQQQRQQQQPPDDWVWRQSPWPREREREREREYWPQRGNPEPMSAWDRIGERGKSREGPTKQGSVATKEGAAVPKMTVKTWNSLTSDPATWPFKLTDTQPWPKDASGKSYNPNAALVRKLGLDNGGKEAPKEAGPGIAKTGKTKVKEDHEIPWSNDMDTNPKIWPPEAVMSPKIQSVGAWVMPADQSTWKPYNLKTGGPATEEGARRWNVQMDTNPRTWPPKIGDEQWGKFGKSTGPGGAWPKWKQFAYHRVTATPILHQGAATEGGNGGPRARNNAYIAVSAVSPVKYPGNQWRKNDIEETPVAQSPPLDADHPVSQLRAAVEPEIYAWKKNGPPDKVETTRKLINATDPLEEQLETLRRGSTWTHNENRDNIKKQLNVISDASESLASRFVSSSPSNSSGKQETTGVTKSGKAGDSPRPNIDQGKELLVPEK